MPAPFSDCCCKWSLSPTSEKTSTDISSLGAPPARAAAPSVSSSGWNFHYGYKIKQ